MPNIKQLQVPDVWIRKIRKLRRNPAAFVKDSKLAMLGERLLGGPPPPPPPRVAASNKKAPSQTASVTLRARDAADKSVPGVDNAAKEPRVLASIFSNPSGRLQIQIFRRRIAEPHLATAIFCPLDDRLLVDQRLVGAASQEQAFVGFRDRYLFAVRTNLNGEYTRLDELPRLFNNGATVWRDDFLSGVRNAVFVDPTNILPALTRATCPKTRVIVFLTQRPSQALERMLDPVDVVVTTKELGTSTVPCLRHLVVDDEGAFVACLKELVFDNMDKEHDMLVPAFGAARPFADLDSLIESKVQGVIVLKGPLQPSQASTFREVAAEISRNVDFVLLRESERIRYQQLCDLDNPFDLILTSLRNGCRYEYRS